MKKGSILHVEKLYEEGWVLEEEFGERKPGHLYVVGSIVFLDDEPFTTKKGTKIKKHQILEFIQDYE